MAKRRPEDSDNSKDDGETPPKKRPRGKQESPFDGPANPSNRFRSAKPPKIVI